MYAFDNQIYQQIVYYETFEPPASIPVKFNYERESEERLVELLSSDIRSERKDAFGEIYNRCRADVWRFIRSKDMGDDVTKDIWGSVWKTALEKLPNFEWRGKAIKTWLISVAYNKLKEFWRSEKTRGEISLSDINVQAIKSIESESDSEEGNSRERLTDEVEKENDVRIAKLREKLKPKEREIIDLYYYKELNCTDISKLLNMKPGAVRTRLSRILRKMRHFSEELSKESK